MLARITRASRHVRLARTLATVKEAGPESATTKFVANVANPYTATTYAKPNLVLTRGQGSYLYDLEDNKYIDFTAGIAVTGLGHSNEEITRIIANQAATLIHCSNLYHNLPAGELAAKMIKSTHEHGGMHDALRVFLCNSGTEANEAALKFARKHGKTISPTKTELVSFTHSFHGRSMGALSVTANPKYQQAFAPLIPDVRVADTTIESAREVIGPNTCGVIIEPIQGEGGVTEIDPEFLLHLRKLCDEHQVILIYDEIQCGLGRTGKLWAHSYLDKAAHPDIFTTAKALGNGFPIGATVIGDKIENILEVGDHGTTYGGNPLGAKIGSYVVDEITRAEFLEGVNAKSAKFSQRLHKIAGQHPEIIAVKGKGLLLGLQFAEGVNTGAIVEEARLHGLLVITAGMNVVRLVPALNIPTETIEQGLAILEAAINTVLKK